MLINKLASKAFFEYLFRKVSLYSLHFTNGKTEANRQKGQMTVGCCQL